MNSPIDHEDLSLDLAGEAVGTLPPEDRARIERHLEGCGACASEMGELRDAAALLASLVPDRTIDPLASAGIRARLLNRVAPEPSGQLRSVAGGRPAAASLGLARHIGSWGGWLIAAGLSSLLLTHHGFHRPVAGGWVLAGVLAATLAGMAAYAFRQGRENARLRSLLDRRDRESDA